MFRQIELGGFMRMRGILLFFLGLVCVIGAQAQSYLPTGVQQSVPVATVTGGGWTECFRETYGSSSSSLATTLSNCSGQRLMMACRVTASSTLAILAQAPRGDVTFPTGGGTHNANGVDWYLNQGPPEHAGAWGFLPGGQTPNFDACDYDPGSNRLCWKLTGAQLVGGLRCGDQPWLEQSAAFERILYMANPAPAGPVPALGGWGLAALISLLGFAGWLARRRRV